MCPVGILTTLDRRQMAAIDKAEVDGLSHIAAIDIIQVDPDLFGTFDIARVAGRVVIECLNFPRAGPCPWPAVAEPETC